ncbi:Hypothetical_protein [Hexamita inflata]|uniref:Hypothetical_protein n=1 Tax=Hexamita inflata TaxID=28002 RepID=A0ABP1IAV7_9EUKA
MIAKTDEFALNQGEKNDNYSSCYLICNDLNNIKIVNQWRQKVMQKIIQKQFDQQIQSQAQIIQMIYYHITITQTSFTWRLGYCQLWQMALSIQHFGGRVQDCLVWLQQEKGYNQTF